MKKIALLIVFFMMVGCTVPFVSSEQTSKETKQPVVKHRAVKRHQENFSAVLFSEKDVPVANLMAEKGEINASS